MPNELLEYFKEKYSKNNKDVVAEQMKKQKVKNTIFDLCKEYLSNVGQIFEFEVDSKLLPYAIEAINEEPLKSMYDIAQSTTETIFIANLKEISFE